MSVSRAKYGATEGISRSNTCTGVVVRVQVTLEQCLLKGGKHPLGLLGSECISKSFPPRFAGVRTSPKLRTYQAKDFWRPGSHGRNRCLFLSLALN